MDDEDEVGEHLLAVGHPTSWASLSVRSDHDDNDEADSSSEKLHTLDDSSSSSVKHGMARWFVRWSCGGGGCRGKVFFFFHSLRA